MSDEINEVTNELPEEISDNSEFLDATFEEIDNSVAAAAGEKEVEKSGDKKTTERKAINVLATEFTLDMYRFASTIRSQGHATLADMLFRECMVINLAANTASNAIGRAHFLKCLEDGFYSSGNVMEYLKFIALCGAGTKNNGELYERAETIHKIYAVSIKTATGKSKKTSDIKL